MSLYWAQIGLGKHVKDVPIHHVKAGLKILRANYFSCEVSISLPKLSALCFYARIFQVRRRFAQILLAVGASVVAYILFAVLSIIWQCKSISKTWRLQQPDKYLNYYQWWLGSAISSVIVDAIVLVLPLPAL
jgi:hypothetical protein